MTGVIKAYIQEAEAAFQTQSASLTFKKAELTQRHRHERQRLQEAHEARWTRETNRRAQRLPRGIRGIWHRLTGAYGRIRKQNEQETYQAYRRDQAQKQKLIERQLQERQVLQDSIRQARQVHTQDMEQLHRDVAHYMKLNATQPKPVREAFREATQQQTPKRGRGRRRRRTRSPDD